MGHGNNVEYFPLSLIIAYRPKAHGLGTPALQYLYCISSPTDELTPVGAAQVHWQEQHLHHTTVEEEFKSSTGIQLPRKSLVYKGSILTQSSRKPIMLYKSKKSKSLTVIINRLCLLTDHLEQDTEIWLHHWRIRRMLTMTDVLWSFTEIMHVKHSAE